MVKQFAHHWTPAGIELLVQPIPAVRSCSVGYWVRSGSCHENNDEEGLAHFIEHTVFKGTKKFPSPDLIAEVSDHLGGHIDAFTGKESACFFGKVLRERLPDLIDLLSDLVADPIFDSDELVREKKVVLEEINQSVDHPDDWVSELFYQNFWQGGSLSHSILGTSEQISQYSSDDIRNYFLKNYRPKNLLIVAAGDLNTEEFISMVESKLDGRFADDNSLCSNDTKPNQCKSFIYNAQRRNLNQASLVMGFPAPFHRHSDRIASTLLCHILGGGMSSRLFLELREKHGLCYQIGSFTSHFKDSGALQVVASCASSNAPELVKRTLAECRRLAENGPSQDELDRAKLQLRTSLVFSMESTGSRMFSLAHQAMHMDRIIDIDQQLIEIDATDLEQVCRVAGELLVPELVGISTLGTKKGYEIRPSDL
ncbi:MAG: insulinase family protein [Holophagaceae bacterium]|nr:insulinase family protein [Holophagaceae bacterium]